jgi:hypothetical protein
MIDISQKALENIGVIIGGIIIYVAPKIESFLKKRVKKSSFVSNLEVAKDIAQELDHLVVKLDASRVCIIDYHNGTSNYSGIPFNFASMSYEARNPNVYPILPTFQSVPISPMVKMLLSLNESKDGYVKTTDSGPDQDLNILHKVHGTQCSYNFKIGPNLVDGVLSINWNTRHADLDKSEVEDVKVSIYRVKALLEKIKKH